MRHLIPLYFQRFALLLSCCVISAPAYSAWTSLGLANNTVAQYVTMVRLSPQNSNVMYAFTQPVQNGGTPNQTGLYRSADNGAQWDLILETNQLGRDLQVISDNTAFLYVLGMGIVYTDDAGVTWQSVPVDVQGNTGIASFQVNPLNIDNITAVIYAAPWIFTTTNRGVDWTPAIGKISDNIDNRNAWVTQFVFTEKNYYLGVDASTATPADFLPDSGLYYSSDMGASWTQSQSNLASVYGIRVDPSNSDIAVANSGGGVSRGVFITVDGGSNWSNLANNMGTPNVTSHNNPGNPVIYATGPGLTPISKAVGNCWRSMQDNLPFSNGLAFVHDIQFDPKNANRLILATDQGVYAQVDTGQYDSNTCNKQFNEPIPDSTSPTPNPGGTPSGNGGTTGNGTTSESNGGGGALFLANLVLLLSLFRRIFRKHYRQTQRRVN